MLSLLLAASLFQVAQAEATQRLDPVACTAQPNFVTRERFPVRGATFRFSGTVTSSELRPDDFTPFALVSLRQDAAGPHELSAVLSVQPATPRRYDVTLRRLINDELRERSIIGRVPTARPVNFELELTADRMMVFRLGEVRTRLPLGDFRPDAIVLGCSSGSFQFDNLVFYGGSRQPAG